MINDTNEITIGTMPPPWLSGFCKNITFTVTEDCNLRCKYCYMTHKNTHSKMSWDIAKKAVDFFLSQKEEFPEPGVIWEFIGGEPFLEIDLIDKICDYIKFEMYRLGHPWFDLYRFVFSTNGLLYDTPRVQEFFLKNAAHVSVGVSVDGNKIKHDLQRVKPDGTGSFEDVKKVVPLWLKQFPGSPTKATFSHDDLPLLKDSVIALWDLGIKCVAANVVFEDVWHEGDDAVFESQLKELSDFIIENEIWKKDYSIRFLDPNIGFPLSQQERQQNWCGSGKMVSVDHKGILYPCVRLQDYSLNNHPPLPIGDIFNGINHDRVRPFLGLTMESQSLDECRNCEVASGCALCVGNNYDLSENGTIYQRSLFICKMHKANVRACDYFWEKLAKTTGRPSQRGPKKREADVGTANKYLYFVTSDSITPHCAYRNSEKSQATMSKEIMEKGLLFAQKSGLTPVFIGIPLEKDIPIPQESLVISHANDPNANECAIPVYDNSGATKSSIDKMVNCILLLNRKSIEKLPVLIKNLSENHTRINLIVEDVLQWNDSDLNLYKDALAKVVPMIAEKYSSDTSFELNVLSDILSSTSMYNCDPGIESYTLAPDGKFYLCPAFYFDKSMKNIGNLETGITIPNANLLSPKHAYICQNCDVFHCRRCIYQNVKATGEVTTPSRNQCLIGHIEREKALELQNSLNKTGTYTFANVLTSINYSDPLEVIKIKQKGANVCL